MSRSGDARCGAERPNLAGYPVQSLRQALIPHSRRKNPVQRLKRMSELGGFLRLAMRSQELETGRAVHDREGRQPRLPVTQPALYLLLRFRNFDQSGSRPAADIAHLALIPSSSPSGHDFARRLP